MGAAPMVEEIQKIKIEEFEIIRVIYPDGNILETKVSGLENRPPAGLDPQTLGALKALCSAMKQLSSKATQFDVEFVIPVKR
jgi:hypothetical protein